jgi:pyruvate formate lyase activating enzyme
LAAKHLFRRSCANEQWDNGEVSKHALKKRQFDLQRVLGRMRGVVDSDDPGVSRPEFFAAMDAANIDLKAFTEGFYKQLCTGSLDAVLATLLYVKHETKTWLEITTLLIPGKNDSSDEVGALCEWVATRLGPDVPLHLTAFHPDWKMLDVPQTLPSTLKRAREIALRTGLRYIYTGNVHDEAAQSTYCHGCGARLIGRDWWGLGLGGRCAACGETCPGLFEALPGSWGARRESLVIAAA